LKAVFIASIPFILWDIWFAKTGVWWFNSDYTIKLAIAGLPLEEWLFFICVPFACVFTYNCLDKFFDLSGANAFNNIIAFTICIVCMVVAALYHNKIYTLVTALAVTAILIYLHFIAKAVWLGQASFIFLILMLGFFPVNGILTGTGLQSPIVNYNQQEFLNIRILTIPVEDFLFGYTQFLLAIYFFKIFQKPNEIVHLD
jgi:lycopene cyclase domain-containing protein